VHSNRAAHRARERALAEIAERQHGVIATRQLREVGFTSRQIEHRLKEGRLHRLHYGVYAVGHRKVTVRGHWMAAVLACGPHTVLSHVSAVALWGIRASATSTVDVIAGRNRRSRPGIRVHTPRSLAKEERAMREGIPVTTVARTLVDVACILQASQLERAVVEAERLHLFDLDAINAACERSRGRRGVAALRSVLGAYCDRATDTRSELERRFLALCRDAGIRLPSVNRLIAGYEVDAVWADERLVVELDSRAYHRTTQAFERDRIRDADLQLAGYRVLRLTHRRLESEPEAVTSAVRSLLADR
jgi:predicted transcriptional regulator of viral defense system/very-short-patch-repair endonuclease